VVRSTKKMTFAILISIFLTAMSLSSLNAQHGGIGVKFSNQNYRLPRHPSYNHFISSLYISIKLGKSFTIFIDSYLYSADGDGFDTDIEYDNNIPMKESNFSDRATVLGPMYYRKLPFFGLFAYGGVGFGWHSLKIGYKERGLAKESSKNYGAHAIIGVSYDIEHIPVIIFGEARYALIYLKDNYNADPLFIPTALHRSDPIRMTGLNLGLLVYFF